VSTPVPVLILGGGIIGTAVAWALAERGVRGIEVVDLDLAGVYASSELNAGGARATWWQPVNIECCRLTLDFFRAHAERFGFRECGYLWLYDDAALWRRALEKRGLQNAHGLGVEALEPGEIWSRFALLDRAREEIVGATFSPRDGLVNPNAVRAWFRREARALGVVFRDRDYVMGVRTARVAGLALSFIAPWRTLASMPPPPSGTHRDHTATGFLSVPSVRPVVRATAAYRRAVRVGLHERRPALSAHEYA